nr:unnamed protein product [Digitaria exilis]
MEFSLVKIAFSYQFHRTKRGTVVQDATGEVDGKVGRSSGSTSGSTTAEGGGWSLEVDWCRIRPPRVLARGFLRRDGGFGEVFGV